MTASLRDHLFETFPKIASLYPYAFRVLDEYTLRFRVGYPQFPTLIYLRMGDTESLVPEYPPTTTIDVTFEDVYRLASTFIKPTRSVSRERDAFGTTIRYHDHGTQYRIYMYHPNGWTIDVFRE